MRPLPTGLINPTELSSLAFDNGFDAQNLTDEKRKELQSTREGILELCHNWGTEDDASFKYNSGNEEPHRGFGHICVSVDDLQAACKRFDEMGAKFKKRPEEGKMRHIAFLLDPDGARSLSPLLKEGTDSRRILGRGRREPIAQEVTQGDVAVVRNGVP